MITPTTGSLPSIYETIDHVAGAATWLMIIVGAYLVHEWLRDDNNDDPDGFA